jgi:hypothetical protein
MRYAAYGSNLHPIRLTERLPSARLLGTANLPDWSLRFHKLSIDASGKCSIVPGTEGVHFAVFEISDDDKFVLDRIEGVGSGYAATSLKIPPFGNCATYIAEASHVDETLRPYDWYREFVLAGADFHGFPDDYVARIASLRAIPDPDTERSASQWALAERIKAGA